MSELEVIEFLSSGESYGLPGEPVGRVETHCSIVFLVGEKAYKLKRPIAFSALDYTTLARREAACRREVELNRRTAPELYLGVLSIRRDEGGGLTFAEAGPIVDWVVVMRRFEQSDLFDHLAAKNLFGIDLARDLAEEIARFHAGAQVADADGGGAEGLMRAIEQNRRDQLTVEAVLESPAIESLYARSVGALQGVRSLLNRRRAGGRVRRCHGDLRLANICLYRGRPTLFDAIEFADELSCIDVLYDLAFLLMDLRHRGLHAQANIVFNRYLDLAADNEGLPALPLMISVRAGTRAFAVAGSSLRRRDPEEGRRLFAAARSLMTFALSLLDPGTPRLIAIGGGTDAARGDLAAALAPAFEPAPGARIMRDDSPGTGGSEVFAAGYTGIFHRRFDTGVERQQLLSLAAAENVPFVGLWVGEARDAPASWHAVDLAHGTEAAAAAVHRLIAAAPPHD